MTEVEKSQARAPSWTKNILILSLGLNLLVVGVVIGAVLRHGGEGAREGRSHALNGFGSPYMRALPKEARREIMRTLRDDGSRKLPDRNARREMFEVTLTALRAQPFEPETVDAAVSRQANTAFSVQREMQEIWLQQIIEMSDAERAAYADAFEQAINKRKR